MAGTWDQLNLIRGYSRFFNSTMVEVDRSIPSSGPKSIISSKVRVKRKVKRKMAKASKRINNK